MIHGWSLIKDSFLHLFSTILSKQYFGCLKTVSMSLDVSSKHTEYMFRHEILKVIIIDGGSPIFSSPESVCSLHHQNNLFRILLCS